MKKTLIVIDMQNDLINGPLGSVATKAILPNVKNKIDEYMSRGDEVIFTRDTHYADYAKTLEGKYLKTKHCIEGTIGWEIHPDIDVKECKHINKPAFSCIGWAKYNLERVEVVGLHTDTSVVSNVLFIRSLFPEAKITVDMDCSVGLTKTGQKAAIAIMKNCQVEIIGEQI